MSANPINMENTLKNLGKRIATCIGLIAIGTALTGQAAYAQEDDLLAKLKATKKLDTAVGQSPAWSTLDASGQATGIMPDIVRAVLKKAGIDATLNPIAMPFDSIIPALVSGKADIAANTMFVTPARAKQVLFTDILLYNSEGLFVAKGNPLGIKSLADLCGHTAATYKGTVWTATLEKASKECSAGKSIEIRLYTSSDLVLQDIAAGRVNGGLVDQYAGLYALVKDPSLKFELATGYVSANRAANGAAFPLNPKYKSFATTFNKAYFELLADGTIKGIFEKYGLTPADAFLRRE
jgi:polar amino acid transport system substrate-binding protein